MCIQKSASKKQILAGFRIAATTNGGAIMHISEKLNKSITFDIIGVAIVFIAAYLSGFLFNDLTSTIIGPQWWAKYVPFGLISAISSSMSLMSTRLVGKNKNTGNILGVITTVISGIIDYLLGNVGAIITYPVTFVLNFLSVRKWSEYGTRVNKRKSAKFIAVIISLAFILGFGLNGLAYQLFGGQFNSLFYIVSFIFSLSQIANILNIFKVTDVWWFWSIYNVAQLAKGIMQGNFANVGKYIYYIINAMVAIPSWKKRETVF